MLMVALWFMSVTAYAASRIGETVVRLDSNTLAAVFGVFASLVVGLLTKYHASSTVKAVVNLLVSGIGGVIAAYTQDGFFEADLKTIVGAVLTAWVVSIATYLGFWKQTGVTEVVQDKTRNFGIGGSNRRRR